MQKRGCKKRIKLESQETLSHQFSSTKLLEKETA